MEKKTKVIVGVLCAAYIAGLGGLYLHLAETRDKMANYQLTVREKYVQKAAFLSDSEAAALEKWRAANPNEKRLDIRGRYISDAAAAGIFRGDTKEAVFLRQLAEQTRPNS